MKYLKLFENFQDIRSICKEYGICYKIGSDDGLVNVDGHVYLDNRRLENIPIKFSKVSGDFWCSNNQLTSLEGCPKEVGGSFYCSENKLTSLEGCPKEVGDNFNCSWNRLTSLKGAPKKICHFDCSHNLLTSLKWCPKEVNNSFSCQSNRLTIIDYLPEWIGGDIYLNINKIRDIKVEDINYRFFGICNLHGNPINDLFRYWEGDLKNFIRELEFEDFIRDDGKSVDMLRFEYALNGKRYNEEDIKRNYNLIWKELNVPNKKKI